jgi:hypothetical protein
MAGCSLWSLDVLRGPLRYKKKCIVFPSKKLYFFHQSFFHFWSLNLGLDPGSKGSLDPSTDLLYWIKRKHLDYTKK